MITADSDLGKSDLENRVRELASEVEGEKHVSRHALEQVRRATAEMAALRATVNLAVQRIDHIGGDVAIALAVLTAHGARLNTLTQDTATIRNDLTALRREMREEAGQLREEFGQLRQEMRDEVGQLHHEVDQLRQETHNEIGQLRQEMHNEIGQLRQEMSETNRKLDLLIAHIVPSGPA